MDNTETCLRIRTTGTKERESRCDENEMSKRCHLIPHLSFFLIISSLNYFVILRICHPVSASYPGVWNRLLLHWFFISFQFFPLLFGSTHSVILSTGLRILARISFSNLWRLTFLLPILARFLSSA